MNHDTGGFMHKLKIIISILAVGNLAAVFLLSVFPIDDSRIIETAAGTPEQTSDSGYFIRLDSDSLTYDGTGKLDLMDGVTLMSSAGPVSDSKIFADIRTGASLSVKEIRYTADTEDGRVSADRNLNLKQYTGPSLTLPDHFPKVKESDLTSLTEVLRDRSDFRAEDGYGNDITDSIAVKYSADENNPGLYHCIFTVTNMFNDFVSKKADICITDSKPVIRLTQNRLYLKRSAAFDPLEYVAGAVDADGTPLPNGIHVEGSVDTHTAGTYQLIYTAVSPDGTSSLPEKLTVTVQ